MLMLLMYRLMLFSLCVDSLDNVLWVMWVLFYVAKALMSDTKKPVDMLMVVWLVAKVVMVMILVYAAV